MIIPLLILAASASAGPSKGDADDGRAAVRRADLDRCAAMAARDVHRFSSLLAGDVAFFPDQMPVARGKEAVRTLLAPFFDAKGPSMKCEPGTVEVSRAADLAYVTGTYDEQGTAAARGLTRGHGKYVSIWRNSGRAWRLVVHIGNAEPLPEPDFGPPPEP